jgi:hypothetical protein
MTVPHDLVSRLLPSRNPSVQADDANLHDLCSSPSLSSFGSRPCSVLCDQPPGKRCDRKGQAPRALLSSTCCSYATGTEPTKMFTASRDVPRPPFGVVPHDAMFRVRRRHRHIELTRVTDAMPARNSRSIRRRSALQWLTDADTRCSNRGRHLKSGRMERVAGDPVQATGVSTARIAHAGALPTSHCLPPSRPSSHQMCRSRDGL